MSNISRLRDAEIANGNLINADDLSAELDQLVNAHNTNDTVLTNIQSGTITLSGVKTFSGANVHSGANTFSGNNAFSGSNTHTGQENFARTADPGTPSDGDFWYNTTSDLFKGQVNGDTKTLVTTDLLGDFPTGYRSGSHPIWTSVSSVTVPSGYICRDTTDATNIVVGSDLIVSLAASGSLGLDSGSEASATWYHVWLCKGSSGVTAIFSTSSTAPTLPTGYDQYKRKLPGAWRNNASSDLIKSVFGGCLYFPTVYHRVAFTPTAASNPTNIVNTTSSLTNVDTNAYVAPDALTAILYHHHSSTSGSSIVQPAGDSSSEYTTQTQSASNGVKDQQKDIILRLDAGQKIDVTISSATNVIAVRGYVVTEAS